MLSSDEQLLSSSAQPGSNDEDRGEAGDRADRARETAGQPFDIARIEGLLRFDGESRGGPIRGAKVDSCVRKDAPLRGNVGRHGLH